MCVLPKVLPNLHIALNRTMTSMAEKECVPCKGSIPPLPEEVCLITKQQLHTSWSMEKNLKVHSFHSQLSRRWITQDFVTAMNVMNKIGQLAEKERHHPNFHLTNWNHLQVDIWTHKVGGLTESDFILAAKIDRLDL
jgi:4a-hydroxytetrahydrobiopterin dehydratase